MDENPYQSPRVAETKPRGGLLLIVLAIVGVIPAGCVCGGVTCTAVSSVGEGLYMVSPNAYVTQFVDLLLALPLGLFVMGTIWFLLGRELWKRRP
jgi:hypothetical protein